MTFILFLFSPAIAAVLILSAAAAFVRTRTAVICCGVIAAFLFIVESLLISLLPGLTSGGHHGAEDTGLDFNWVAGVMLLGFATVTWLYFIYGFRRVRQKNNAAS